MMVTSSTEESKELSGEIQEMTSEDHTVKDVRTVKTDTLEEKTVEVENNEGNVKENIVEESIVEGANNNEGNVKETTFEKNIVEGENNNESNAMETTFEENIFDGENNEGNVKENTVEGNIGRCESTHKEDTRAYEPTSQNALDESEEQIAAQGEQVTEPVTRTPPAHKEMEDQKGIHTEIEAPRASASPIEASSILAASFTYTTVLHNPYTLAERPDRVDQPTEAYTTLLPKPYTSATTRQKRPDRAKENTESSALKRTRSGTEYRDVGSPSSTKRTKKSD